MGGMITELVALRAPERVRSLTSTMSTTGDPRLGGPSDAALALPTTPPASPRQLAAILTTADRPPALKALPMPCLVVHGADDQLVDVSGGRATAAAPPARAG